MTDPWIVETFDIQSHFSMPKARSKFMKNIFVLRMLAFIIRIFWYNQFWATIFLKYFLIFVGSIFLFTKYNKLLKMLNLFLFKSAFDI